VKYWNAFTTGLTVGLTLGFGAFLYAQIPAPSGVQVNAPTVSGISAFYTLLIEDAKADKPTGIDANEFINRVVKGCKP
jgi:hypothetical protein